MQADADALGEVAAGVAAAELDAIGEGRIAVVVPAELRGAVGEALRRGLGDRVAVDASTALERAVSLLGVGEAKGLEFDSVIVVEPAAIMAASPRGASDLYVALTRTTNRLGVLHSEPLPSALTPTRAVASVAAIG
jgi:DNA helicase IV